jgi:predicted transcriptional regulator
MEKLKDKQLIPKVQKLYLLTDKGTAHLDSGSIDKIK